MELEKAIEELEELKRTIKKAFWSERYIYKKVISIKTVLKELDKLNKRIEYALAIAYDYDGYYNSETKQGNAEGLAMTIDDMVDVLKGKMKGVE
jgi:hypothetical protein